ncbi:hypothetical protein M9H77_22443 [Catharanthus roseus]|uniref:Uncharacterized protein n=1 Tax=Catharanthus roseus TaxID=4058 RepID=A0ACC0ARZ1_CATRO|nr:hypothetical protein M9H77_22443 [Catharanthus roseus]
MDEKFHKIKGDYRKYYDIYNYGGYNCGRSFQTLGTTTRPLRYNNLKLPLLCGTFGSFDYEAWEQQFQLVLKSLSYELNIWWNCKCENRRRMGAQPIKTWSLMKQSLRNKFGIVNHVRQGQVQPKVKFMESLMVEESPKIKELSQAKIEESLKIHVEDETSEEEPLCIMNEKRIEDKGRNMEKELGAIHEELPISLSLNPLLMCHKDYENHMEANLELFKVNLLVFENSNLRKEDFEQIFKDFGDEHLYYHIPFKDGFPSWCTYKMQAIQDLLISKSVFEEESFHCFTNFYKKFNMEFSILARILVDVHREMTGFPRQLCLFLVGNASNQASYSTTLLLSFDIDYGGSLLMSIDLLFLSIDYTLSWDQKGRMKFVEFIYFMNHEAYDANHKMFGMKLLVFDPGGWSKDGEFEAQGKYPKLFIKYSTDKEQTRNQFGAKFC